MRERRAEEAGVGMKELPAMGISVILSLSYLDQDWKNCPGINISTCVIASNLNTMVYLISKGYINVLMIIRFCGIFSP